MRAGILLLVVLGVASGCGDGAPPGGTPAGAGAAPSAAGVGRARFFETVRTAEAAEKAGDAPLAETRWREALALRPGHETATLALAALRLRAGGREEAVALVEVLRAAQPLLHRPAMILGDVFAATGPEGEPDLDRAAALFEEAARKEPIDTGPWLRLARVRRLQGRAAEARGILETVLGTHPGNGEALRGLAEIALAGGDASGAAALFLRALKAGIAAEGRKEVPSEMDTAASFVAAGAAAPRNVEALLGLARAARLLGRWPENVPADLRLPDVAVLGPVDASLPAGAAAAGWPCAVAAAGGEGAAVLIPRGPEAPPVLAVVAPGPGRAAEAPAGLPACSSAAAADLDGDGAEDLVLGGLHAGDPAEVRIVRRWRGPGRSEAGTGLTGRILAAVRLATSHPGVLVAGRSGTGPPALWLVAGRPGASGPGASRVADGRFIAAVPVAGGAAVLRARGEVLRLGFREDGVAELRTIADAGAGASCLAAGDVTGDGAPDLLVGRAAPSVAAHQALAVAPHDPFDSVLVFAGSGDGTSAGALVPLAGLPPLPVRALACVPSAPGGRDRVVVACGGEEPGAFAPSRCLDWSAGRWIARALPSPDPAIERAFAVVPVPGDPSRVLLLRGGLSAGLRLPSTIVPIP